VELINRVINMASYKCPDCKYIYDESKGEPHEGFAPNTLWVAIPEEWCCPDCAVRDKLDFVMIEGTAGEVNISPSSTLSGLNKMGGSDVNAGISNATMIVESALDVAVAEQKLEGQSKPQVTKPQSGAALLKWICITCGHIYDEELGDEVEGFAPGTRFEDIPNDWCCPDCGATKEDYVLYQEKSA
jgi:rubredoxin